MQYCKTKKVGTRVQTFLVFYERFLVSSETFLVLYETFLAFYETNLDFFERCLLFPQTYLVWEAFLVFYETCFAPSGLIYFRMINHNKRSFKRTF